MYLPAAMDGAAPNTVTRSRCPRALMRSTQKPLSALWKVTRSTRPAIGSRSPDEPDPVVSIQTCLSRGHRGPDHIWLRCAGVVTLSSFPKAAFIPNQNHRQVNLKLRLSFV